MKILDDLLSVLDFEAGVGDIRQGPFQTAVVTRHCGLASTPHQPGNHQERAPVGQAGELQAMSALELARMAYSSNPLEAAIGMAAINSLIEVDKEYCVGQNAADLLAERGKGKKVAVVGHFPFVPELSQAASECWVIEQHPREGDLTESEADRVIPEADVVAITGATFTNHTVEAMLARCRPGAYVVLLGPTVPLSPVLFDHGVSAVSGTRVVNVEAVLRGVSQGATFRQLKGIELLTMRR